MLCQTQTTKGSTKLNASETCNSMPIPCDVCISQCERDVDLLCQSQATKCNSAQDASDEWPECSSASEHIACNDKRRQRARLQPLSASDEMPCNAMPLANHEENHKAHRKLIASYMRVRRALFPAHRKRRTHAPTTNAEQETRCIATSSACDERLCNTKCKRRVARVCQAQANEFHAITNESNENDCKANC